MDLSKRFFTSDHIEMVQRVFKSTLAYPWFDRSAANDQALCMLIVGCFQRGVTGDGELMAKVESVARARGSKNSSASARPPRRGTGVRSDLGRAWRLLPDHRNGLSEVTFVHKIPPSMP